ncbi:MAG: hypothetical protein KDA45_02660 [Planctomycetales bacterium]|nr:hypothetical protein [Planctomycetales bacterium]
MWLLLTLAVAAYSTLKPSTTAAELRYLPPNWVVWLDENYDLRTLVMALAVMLLPAILLASGGHNARRRWILVLATGGLMGLEAAQLWIPTRGFSWADLSYSLAGGLLPELLVLMLQWLGVVHRQQAAVCPAEN